MLLAMWLGADGRAFGRMTRSRVLFPAEDDRAHSWYHLFQVRRHLSALEQPTRRLTEMSRSATALPGSAATGEARGRRIAST
jgi:hypothetical protein